MSDEDVVFNCYFNGKFLNSNGNVSTYIGGDFKALEGKPKEFFTILKNGLGFTLYGQRIWYKLPYETFSELKYIFDGDLNFQNMCKAVVRTKVVDIFTEANDDEDAEDVVDSNGTRDDVNESDGELLEEEARVEKNISNFVDEEEHCYSEVTPPNSVCEDNDEVQGKRRYETYSKSSGEIKLEQVNESIPAFKEAIVDYVLKTGYNVKYTRWGSEKSEVRCTLGGGCPFRIYCSFEEPARMFMVKFCNVNHSCNKDGYSKIVKDSIIAQLFLNDIRNDHELKPKTMQEQLQDRYDLVVSNEQCRKAKSKALKMLQAEHDEQFARLKDYVEEIKRANKGTIVEMKTVHGDDGLDLFDCFYVCFKGLRETWKASCRPIIGIDGCFLKNTVKGQLLAAVGRDANNQIYHIAWAVVQVENTNNWIWFINKLKADLGLDDGEGFTLISDRQKGLIIAVDQELPKIEHRMCARHIYGNLARNFPGRSRMKGLFWKVAKSFTIAEYEEAIEEVKQYDLGVYEAMMAKNPQNCSRAFFSSTACCEDVQNNFSESYNNVLNKAREMPLVEMLETIRRQAMVRIDTRRLKAKNHTGKYSLKVASVLEEEGKFRKNCRAFPGPNGWYEVTECGTSYKVHMIKRNGVLKIMFQIGI